MCAFSWIAANLAGLSLSGIGSARAAEPPPVPNMVGTWTGTSETVVFGQGGHHPGSQTLQDEPRLRQVAYTLTVAGQDVRQFWGTIASDNFSEPFAAAYSTSHVYAYGADTDGFYHFKSHGPDKMELCYTQPASSKNKSIAAGCTVFTRKMQ